MKSYIATVSSQGQVTIPADVRRTLGADAADKVVFVVTDDGAVELWPARFTLGTVSGSIDALPGESADLDREIGEAAAEDADRKMRRMRGR